MNNFPAMTEERRQELIAECEEEIAHLKEMMRGNFPMYSEEVYRSKVERQQIVLAALTAEPVGVFYEASPGDWYQGSADGSQLYTKPLFTAPPAPVLKPIELPTLETWRNPDAVRAQSAYRVLVEKAFRAAGCDVV